MRHFSTNSAFANLGREAAAARHFWRDSLPVVKNVDSARRKPLLSLSLFGLLLLRAEQR